MARSLRWKRKAWERAKEQMFQDLVRPLNHRTGISLAMMRENFPAALSGMFGVDLTEEQMRIVEATNGPDMMLAAARGLQHPVRIGVDLGRPGGDRTAVAIREGRNVEVFSVAGVTVPMRDLTVEMVHEAVNRLEGQWTDLEIAERRMRHLANPDPPARMDALFGFGTIRPEQAVRIEARPQTAMDHLQQAERELAAHERVLASYGLHPRATIPKEPPVDPRLAAERLLRAVLPEDLHVSLSATDKCVLKGKSGNSYKLQKGSKTICTKVDGSVHSCCIEFPPGEPKPDSDRIVAEYILLTNDEPKYLATANLTWIGGTSQMVTPAMQEGVFGAMRGLLDGAAMRIANAIDAAAVEQWTAANRENQGLVVYNPIGATVTMRRPPMYRPGAEEAMARQRVTPTMLCAEMFRLVFNAEHLRRPFPEWNGIGHFQRELNSVEVTIPEEAIRNLTLDDIRERYLRWASVQLIDRMSPLNMNLMGFLPFEIMGGRAGGIHSECETHFENKHLRMRVADDYRSFSVDVRLTRFEIMCVVAR